MIKISAIILCAGISTRMGEDKTFLDFNGEKAINLILKKTSESKIVNIIAVAGRNKLKIKQATGLEKIATNEKNNLRSLSIKKGLSLMERGNGCLIWPVDYPLVNTETIKKIINNYDHDSIVCPSSNNKGGHPILVGSNLINSLKKINSNTPLRDWVGQQKKTVLKVQDDWINYEMNKPHEYLKAKRINESS
ncbi:hypothetical protein CL645_01435 [bacterium]|mgnify:CR=1 FL=1|nr:hypothetical protein [bacterium]